MFKNFFLGGLKSIWLENLKISIQNNKLIFCCLLFFVGIAGHQLARLEIIVLLMLTGVYYLLKNERIFLAIMLLFFVCGLIRLQVSQWGTENIRNYADKTFQIIGIVAEEPDVRLDHQKITFKVEKLNGQNVYLPGRILVNHSLYPAVEYGHQLEFSCKLRLPGLIDDFNYQKFLARYKIYLTCYQPRNFKITAKNQADWLKANLLKIKQSFVAKINQLYPEPQASFLGGLILGAKRSIPKNVINDFNITGTTHIVAISGYNITVIIVLMKRIFESFYLNKSYIYYLIIFLIAGFVVLTGMQSSLVRAAIMGVIVISAERFGRLANISRIIVLTAVIMVLINPLILTNDVGFQLSFLATLGLIYLTPIFEKYLHFVPKKLAIQESLTTTLASTAMTLPLILYNFGRLSLIAPLANVLVLPLIPISMLIGFLSVIFSFVNFQLGQYIAYLAWLVMSLKLLVLNKLAQIPYASIDIGQISLILLVVFYGLLVFWIKSFGCKR